MTGTVIMEVLCVAGVLFMIRFLVALFRDGKAKSPSGVVYLSLPSPQSENGVFYVASKPGARSGRSDTRHQPGFQVIVGGTKPPARRVG